MSIDRLQLLRNVGQFDSVAEGAHIPFKPLTIVYAENGRGKTTLAAILRSLGTGNATFIEERHRLGSAHPPHVVVAINGAAAPITFQNGAWSAPGTPLSIYDDTFVAENVCSGIEIAPAHRQNLHELILGARGVALNDALQSKVDAVEEHNRTIRTRGDAISAASRGPYSVDTFCALTADPTVDTAIQESERRLAAARSADVVPQRPGFLALELPGFDVAALNALLRRTLPELEEQAAAKVKAHLESLGEGAGEWVGEGMERIARASAGRDHDVCPFCAQDLEGSEVIRHYQAYFSAAYDDLKRSIAAAVRTVSAAHSGEVQAAFERAVRVWVETRTFWKDFAETPDLAVDTAAIARAWSAAHEAVLAILRGKQATPLEAANLPIEALAAIEAFETSRAEIATLSAALIQCNQLLTVVKEQSAVANVATLAADLARLKSVKARHAEPAISGCAAYLDAKAAKATTERERDDARTALTTYRTTIFPAYETAINNYLQRFNAGFRLGTVNSVNNRAGSSATYSVLINNVPVALNADRGASFRNTLSAGDRNVLALAFFFASLDQDQGLAQKVVVIDDPMTSLDEHRSLTTVQEIRRLLTRTSQVIVLSHSKPFLCALWEGADGPIRSAVRVARSGAGSTLAVWDVNQDCITEHDRRHELVTTYCQVSDPARERAVAGALRPILEAFMRVSYPGAFPPGTLLGPFLGVCQARLGSANELLNAVDMTELRALLDYANRFHHDNPTWETEVINDAELAHFCGRTLAFTRRS